MPPICEGCDCCTNVVVDTVSEEADGSGCRPFATGGAVCRTISSLGGPWVDAGAAGVSCVDEYPDPWLLRTVVLAASLLNGVIGNERPDMM